MIKIYDYKDVKISDLFFRTIEGTDVESVVVDIINNVKRDGDKALFEYSRKFDNAKLDSLEVSECEMNKAFESTEPKLIEVMEKAAQNIYDFHINQKKEGFKIEKENGIVMGQKVTAIEKVGIYIPGGTASYPSTVLMNAIPAKIAGCKEIIMVSPPTSNGEIAPVILAAAKIAGVDRVFKLGGAQSIAALAYGTKSIPKVDKIVGPGNAYVAEAKRQVFGLVSIDMIAGPSEILIVADKTANGKFLAADLLSQAEHDVLASAVLVTPSLSLAKEVQEELEKQLNLLPRQDIARKSIEDNGKIIIAESLEQSVEISNALAPEHLELSVENPFDLLEKVVNAGSVFLGNYAPEALGDYFSGANHTLPTSGTARFSSPLSVDDFVKRTQFTYYTKEAFKNVCEDVAIFASAEGLEAHGKSSTIRFED